MSSPAANRAFFEDLRDDLRLAEEQVQRLSAELAAERAARAEEQAAHAARLAELSRRRRLHGLR